jgi:benzodiazapine receptor
MDCSANRHGRRLPGFLDRSGPCSPVWTVLYAMMAVAAWLVWRNGGIQANRNALSLFLIQLAVNAIWSWLFFAWKLGAWAFADIVLLWVLIIATLVSFWRVSKLAGALLVPYLLWVTFAGVLNHALWQLNPQIL